MRAIVYARISREEQSVYSVGEQLRQCQEYCAKEKYELIDTYIDDGFSAKDTNRPALQSLLNDIPKKKFDIIIIWKLDRLTRNTLDGLNMVQNDFKPYGVEFASVTEDIDTSTPDGMMMFTIRLSMAQNEREKIAERVAMGQLARAKSGKRNTSARPYGYNVADDLVLEVNEDEAPWLRQIFEWYTSGWGRAKIARTLNEKEVPANRGGKWSEKIIGDIIGNITYTGCVHYKPKNEPESKRIIVPHTHPAIISMEVYEKANAVKDRRRDHDMNLSSYEFPFSTILKCAVCGRSYHGKMNGQRSRFYRCAGKYRPIDPCNASDIMESKVAELLFAQINVESATSAQVKRIDVHRIDAEKERKRLEKQLHDSRERRKKWAKAMADDKLDYETYSELIDEENKKMASIQQQVEALPVETAPQGKTSKDIADTLIYIRSEWPHMSDEKRKQLIQSHFSRIVIGKFGSTWKILGMKLS